MSDYRGSPLQYWYGEWRKSQKARELTEAYLNEARRELGRAAKEIERLKVKAGETGLISLP